MKRDYEHLTKLFAAMQQDCGASADADDAKALSRATLIWETAAAGDARKAPPGAVAGLRCAGDAADVGLSAAWATSGVTAAGAPADAEGADWIAAFGPNAAPAPLAADLVAAAPAAADVVMTDDLIRDGPGVGAGAGAGWRLRFKPVFDPLLAERVDYLGAAVFFRSAKISPGAVAALASGAAPAALLAERPDLRVAHLPYPAAIDAAAKGRAPRPPTRSRTTPELVSVVIPNRNSPELIAAVLEGVLGRTSSGGGFGIEVIVADNGGESDATRAVYEKWREDPRFRVDIHPAPFNFSAMVNRGAALARGDALLLLNNDIEVTEPDWLARMVETLAAPRVGVVGARLLFPDRTVQHMGVIVGHGGVAGHDRKGMAPNAEDPLGRTLFPHLREAVTAAAMLVRREVWESLGGFDETVFPVAFNDVDFCLRAGAAGWRAALDPRATLIHHEGVSRRGGLSMRRFLAHQRERAALRARHGTIGRVDRFESPWRDPDRLTPTFRMLDRVPEMRF